MAERERKPLTRAKKRYTRAMKRSLCALGAISFLCLSGCSNGTPYCDANGEIAETASTYREAMVEERASSLIARAQAGETVYFFHASSTCSACSRYESAIAAGLAQTNLRVSLLYRSSGTEFDETAYWADVGLLQATYPSDEGGTTGFQNNYPRFYRLQGNACEILSFNAYADSGTSFSSYLGRVSNLNGLTHFRTYEKAASFAARNSCPLYLYDDAEDDAFAFYFAEIRSRGQKKETPFAILDFAEMSDEQKTAALAGFSLESYAPRIRLGQTVRDIKSEAASAASLVASYY